MEFSLTWFLFMLTLFNVNPCKCSRKLRGEDKDLLLIEVESWEGAPRVHHIIKGTVIDYGRTRLYDFKYKAVDGGICDATFYDSGNGTGENSFSCDLGQRGIWRSPVTALTKKPGPITPIRVWRRKFKETYEDASSISEESPIYRRNDRLNQYDSYQ